MTDVPTTMLAMRSLLKEDGVLELGLHEVPVPEPGPDQLLVRVEAAPVNPSDLAVMYAMPNLPPLTQGGTPERPILSAKLPDGAVEKLRLRVGRALGPGFEGAGVVVKAGASSAAEALLGRTVATFGGGLYAEYKLADRNAVIALPDDATAADGASAFVNPMTAQGMLETMRREGHSALAHTAASSNLGRMLNKLCLADDVPLVNIVRKPEHEAALRELGASHVVNSAAPDFADQLFAAVAETGATLGFDAVGGGPLAGQILQAMTAALGKRQTEFLPYGPPVKTQVYVYGRLDFRTIEIPPTLGMYWNVGGWLLFDFWEKLGAEGREKLSRRLTAELKTTFASRYAAEISLAQALDLKTAEAYAKRATGEKYLIRPQS